MDESIVIKRSELYRRVWAESTRRVGCDLGVWPQRMANICERNKIPVPTKGYWNYSQEERHERQETLPDPHEDWEITFRRSQPGPSPLDTKPQITVPAVIRRYHPLIRSAREKLGQDYFSNHGRCYSPSGAIDIQVSRDSVKRALRVLDTLFKEFEKRGWPVSLEGEDRRYTVVTIRDCKLCVSIAEGWRQEPHELEDGEKQFDAECNRERRRQPYQLVPNGRLSLEVGGIGGGNFQKWRDGKKRRLEGVLDDVIEAIPKLREGQLEQDEAERQREQRKRDETNRRHNLAMACKEEEDRIDWVLEESEGWAKSQVLRDFIRARRIAMQARGVDIGPDTEAGQWLAWATRQADRLDPLTKSPPSILDKKPPTFFSIIGAREGWWRAFQPDGTRGPDAFRHFKQRWWNKRR